jgi:hypothetical protein
MGRSQDDEAAPHCFNYIHEISGDEPVAALERPLGDGAEKRVPMAAAPGNPPPAVSSFPHKGIEHSLGMKAQMLIELDRSLVHFCHG